MKETTVAKLIEELRLCSARVEWYSRNLSRDQVAWRPEAERWSVADCIRHLITANRQYLPTIDRAIAQLRERKAGGRGPYALGVFGGWFAGLMEPPVRNRFKAPAVFVPAVMPPEPEPTLFSDFLGVQNELIERIGSTDGFDLTKAKVISPASRFVRFNLAAAFEVIAAHERRHLWQADQLIAAAGFPAK